MLNIKTALISLLAASSLIIAPSAKAQDADMDAATQAALEQLDAALPGTLIHNPFDMDWKTQGNDLRSKVVDADAFPSGQAVSARMKKKQPKAWDSTLSTSINTAVSKGEEIQIIFYARTKKAAPGKDTADITLFLGRNEEPYDSIIAEGVLPSGEWELMTLQGTAAADFPAGTLRLQYQLGKAAQTVEFGPVYISTLGQTAAQ